MLKRGFAVRLLPGLCAVLALSCRKAPPEPEPRREVTPAPAAAAPSQSPTTSGAGGSAAVLPLTPTGEGAGQAGAGGGGGAASALSEAELANSPTDPLSGKFSLADATVGLEGSGKLVADLDTDLGKLECELYDDKAPVTVANFVGLARGLRPWKSPEGKWVKRPGYDGTTFHRVVKGFMIQGGDPKGSGAGEPGYTIPDEIWPGAKHDQRGLLCMANRGPNTNGMQFFIMDGSAPHLDSGYTIFGKCGPEAVVEKLANVPVQGERASSPTKIKKVTIRRAAAKK